MIARNAGVAEGTLLRYFATKDELINTLYLHLKQDLPVNDNGADRSITDAKNDDPFAWNSYISWGLNHPGRAIGMIRQSAVISEKLHQRDGTTGRRYVPELRDGVIVPF